jgi:small conductance mechanosensitive channel
LSFVIPCAGFDISLWNLTLCEHEKGGSFMDWDINQLISSKLFISILQSILITIGVIVLIRISKYLRRKVETKFIRANLDQDHITQIRTLLVAVDYILQTMIIFLGIIWILSIFGVNIVPLLTTVGIASLGITLAAQTILRDYIAGLLILLENIFLIGDTVTINAFSGIIEKITLRVTYLIDSEGRRIIIPNGEIRTVTRGKSAYSQFLLKLSIPLTSEIGNTIRTLESNFSVWSQNEILKGILMDMPRIFDSNIYTDSSREIRIIVRAIPEKKDEAAVILFDWIKNILKENRIELI